VLLVPGAELLRRGLRVSDGRQLFTLSSGAYTGASPAISNGRAFYGTYENEVLSVDLKTHRIVWHYRHPERNFPFYSSAALSAGRVFVGGRDKMMHALDAATGKEAWSFQTGARIDSSPAIAGGLGYVGSNDGKLYVFDTSSGKVIQQFDAGGPLSASPAIAGGRIVIGSQDGKLFCLGYVLRNPSSAPPGAAGASCRRTTRLYRRCRRMSGQIRFVVAEFPRLVSARLDQVRVHVAPRVIHITGLDRVLDAAMSLCGVFHVALRCMGNRLHPPFVIHRRHHFHQRGNDRIA